MANSIDKLAKEIKKEILSSDERKPQPYDTQAEVVRVVNGTAWVHIPGGVEETPVKLTIDAKKGDMVNIHVEKGTAWITGNGTRPPTDDARANVATHIAEGADVTANEALNSAKEARAAADNATEDAARANAAATEAKTSADAAVIDAAAASTAASEAKADASAANTAAQQAITDAATANTAATEAKADAAAANTAAGNAATAASEAKADASAAQTDASTARNMAQSAQESAENASEYASRAYANLSTLQSLTETLDWITAHGTMALTTDTVLDPRHVYFVSDTNGDYIVGGQHYAVVSEPDVADISTYYELSINESLNNYVATHLAVDSEGLWIIPDAGGNKVLIATGSGNTYTLAGTYIIGKENGSDVVLAKFGNTARIGKEAAGNGNVVTKSNGMDLRVGTTTVGSLTQIQNYNPWEPDNPSPSYTYDNVLRLHATQIFELVSEDNIIMEAGTIYVTSTDTDSPDYDPEGSPDEQPTVTINDGTDVRFEVPNGSLHFTGRENKPSKITYYGEFANLWEEVSDPTGNPYLQWWYEKYYPYPEKEYIYYYLRSTDTTVTSGKTYYQQVPEQSLGFTVSAEDAEGVYGIIGLQVNNNDSQGMTRGVYDNTLPYQEWMIGRDEEGTMKLFGKTLSDYVVDQGTLGVWTYRKWESGVSECWCTWSGTVASYTTVLGGYGYYKDINFPTGMFNVAPKPLFTANVGTSFGLASSVMQLTATSGRFFVISNTSGSQTITLHLYLIGTWK